VSGTRARLDAWLVASGLAPTRERAQALIMAGRVRIDGQTARKASQPVPSAATVELTSGPEHVSRGALKLLGALACFRVSTAGRVAVDVGASTGGFTEVWLQRGALRVYAVDVGYGQLHERLRNDPRVCVRERVNARALSRNDVPEACGLASMDVSFISVTRILPALRQVLSPDADLLVLVKPQFEVGRAQVGRGGLVKDPNLHRAALSGVAMAAVDEHGYALLDACPSPIAGAQGNREFFLHLRPEGSGLARAAWETLSAQVTAPAPEAA
jgi:23S rRNA (cytidine1920-2'-O)/16S rRNA (cytidine1409-2'-O)-methyltransferase